MSRPGQVVVLVHGLWMHGVVFLPLQHWLAREGFACRRFSYPSLRHGLDANAAALARFVASIEAPTIHLLGHSLGGLVILKMLAHCSDSRLRRAVLLGSPCAGSHCAEVLLGIPALAPIVGRSIRDWQQRPRPGAAPGVEIGVVAGSRSFGLGRVIPGLPQPNDGVVSVDETRLAQASDVITLPVAHSQMLLSRDCAVQAAAFLHGGRFEHGTPA